MSRKPEGKQAPPKLTKKQQEALRQEMAMKQAVDDAQRLFKFHERERRTAEQQDRLSRDNEIFAKAQEADRIAKEAEAYKPIGEELERDRKLAIAEYRKHDAWNHVMDVSWLPSVHNERDIRAFVEAWKEEQEEEFDVRGGSSKVNIKVQFGPTYYTQAGQPVADVEKMDLAYIRNDAGPSVAARKKRVDNDLQMAVLAVELCNNIWKAYDAAFVEGDKAKMNHYRSMLILVYDQILSSVDIATVNILHYMDVFFHRDEEHFLKAVPKGDNASIRFGIWAKNTIAGQPTRNVTNIKFPDIGISVDPKDNNRDNPSSYFKLPKMLYKENCAMRVYQLTFDPFSVHSSLDQGQENYALDCVLVVESMLFQDRVRKEKGTDWSSRLETAQSRRLNKQEYPPKTQAALETQSERKTEEYLIKVTFEIPENVVIRQKSPTIGKWNAQENKWDHCSVANYTYNEIVRKCSFHTSDLTAMSVIQEKGFDVPYEQWRLFPFNNDEVLYVIEVHRREEPTPNGSPNDDDGEIRILVQDAMCKLIHPSRKELAPLRAEWMPPATLLRLLARAGYNFILQDADAKWLPHILPKTKEMEWKGYNDIAQHCTRHAVASTRHNKMGEDPNMALFRISKERRHHEGGEHLIDVDDDDKWHCVRFERDRCVLAAFKDSDPEPDLSDMPGKETHLNVHMMLKPEYPPEEFVPPPNHLLQNAVFQLLSLTRPFTWG